MILLPAANAQQGSNFPPGPGPNPSGQCIVFLTGDFESECILPIDKPGSDYINELENTLIACQGMTVTYTAHLADGSTAVNWLWNVDGAVTWENNGDGSITVHWGDFDSGTISVEVTDADGNVCSVTKTVMLMERPVASVNTVPDWTEEDGRRIIYVCRGESVEFMDVSSTTNTDIAGYYWRNNWSGDASSSQNFIVSNVLEKMEIIHRVYNNCGCYDEIAFEIRVNDGETLELGCYGTVCAHQEVTYTAISPSCDAYMWSVDGGSIQAGQGTPTVTVVWDNPSSGFGTIGIDGTLCGEHVCPGLLTKRVPILIDGLGISGQQTACVGEAVEYSVPLYGSTHYVWHIWSDSTYVSYNIQENKRILKFTHEGTFYIAVDYECDFLDCHDLHSDTLVVTVKSPLVVAGDSRICVGNSYDLHTEPVGTVALWSVRDSVGTLLHSETNDSLSYVFTQAGKYYITAENDDYCRSAGYLITVIDAPVTPSIGENPSVTCPHSSVLLTGEPSEPSYSLVWRPQCSSASPQSVSGNEVTINYGDEVCDVAVYNYDRITGCLSAQPYIHHVSPFQLADYNVGPYTVCPGSSVTLAAPSQDNVIYEWQLDEYKQYCASVQGDVYNDTAELWVNELTGAGAYPTTFNMMLYRTYCSTLRDTVTVSLTVTDSIGSMSIEAIPNVCQGDVVPLNGYCSGDDYHWSIYGCEYYTLTSNSVTFDEPGVFTATFTCNPYDFCDNHNYLLSESTTVQVHPLPPFVALLFADGNVSTLPPLSEEEYHFEWVPTGPDSHTVPMTPGVDHYTCIITRQEFPNCSRVIESDVDTTCHLVSIDFNGFNYCNSTASFSFPGLPSGTQVSWYVMGGEYGEGRTLDISEQVAAIPFARLGDYLVQAYAIYDGQCYRGYYTITVDFLPSFDIIKHCTALELRNNSRTLTGEGNMTVSCNGTQYTFPVTQISLMISNLPDGEYTFSLVSAGGVAMPCPIGTVTVQNTGGALLTVETEYGDHQACDNTALNLIVHGVPESDIDNVRWTFCDGSAFSTGTNTLYHTFRQGNGYVVTVTLVDVNGCPSYGTLNLNSAHNDLKDAFILFDREYILCPGNSKSIEYISTSTEDLQGVNYLWNETPPLTQESHSYVYSTGDYKVTATDGNHCKAMAMANVPFKNQPQAVIVTDGTALCVKNPITFYGSLDPNTDDYSFEWQVRFNGNVVATSTDPNLAYTPQQTGYYTVSLSITNNEDCTGSTDYSFAVNQQPEMPHIDYDGNRCIDQPPVNLVGSNYYGELHWSNGHTGPTANYFYSGDITAWYYDPVTGCRSPNGHIYIPPAPDFDALLTGCYNICKFELEDLSPLNVWGLMPNNYTDSFNWSWRLNGDEIANGDRYPNPFALRFQGFGDYQLDVSYNEICKVGSPLLTLHDSCLCDSMDITYTCETSVGWDCNITYIVNLKIRNVSDRTICPSDIWLTSDLEGVRIVNEPFDGNPIEPGAMRTYVIRLNVENLGQPSLSLTLFDECNHCNFTFSVDLSDVKLGNCPPRMERRWIRRVDDLTTQEEGFFEFRFDFSPGQRVVAFWSEPQTVLSYSLVNYNSVEGLGMISKDSLLRLRNSHEQICFYAIVCNGKQLCKHHYCISARDLYDILYPTILPPFPPLPPLPPRPPRPPRPHFPFFSTGAGNSYGGEGIENLEIRNSKFEISISPNPTSGVVRVMGDVGEIVVIEVLDMQGRKLIAIEGTDSFDVSSLPAGQYIACVTTDSDTHYLKLIKK